MPAHDALYINSRLVATRHTVIVIDTRHTPHATRHTPTRHTPHATATAALAEGDADLAGLEAAMAEGDAEAVALQVGTHMA